MTHSHFKFARDGMLCDNVMRRVCIWQKGGLYLSWEGQPQECELEPPDRFLEVQGQVVALQLD